MKWEHSANFGDSILCICIVVNYLLLVTDWEQNHPDNTLQSGENKVADRAILFPGECAREMSALPA